MNINTLLITQHLFIIFFVMFFIISTKRLFIKNNWLDHSNDRKIHKGSIPVNGGLAMFFGLLLGLLIISHNYYGSFFLLICSFLALILGFIDDNSDLSPNTRMLAQIIICLIAFSYGLIKITTFGDIFGIGSINFNRLSLIITLLAFMAGMNSFNLIDGIDGLASGIAIIAFLAVAYLANLANAGSIFTISTIYICALIPFFLINISNKKVFMGDSGSLFIGFGIAWLLIDSSQGEYGFIKPVTVLWIFAIPLIDLISVVFVRIISGKSPFKPDKTHIHFQLINKLKLKKKTTMMIILTLSGLIALIGVLLQHNHTSESVMFFFISGILILYMITLFCIEKRDKTSAT
jgi:UDP-GlcNAc:undecaprenyl-phosphate/decaprenyl-phosphate GlcNAc-1-phosphate transferase